MLIAEEKRSPGMRVQQEREDEMKEPVIHIHLLDKRFVGSVHLPNYLH